LIKNKLKEYISRAEKIKEFSQNPQKLIPETTSSIKNPEQKMEINGIDIEQPSVKWDSIVFVKSIDLSMA
jgi:hypothetical protein